MDSPFHPGEQQIQSRLVVVLGDDDNNPHLRKADPYFLQQGPSLFAIADTEHGQPGPGGGQGQQRVVIIGVGRLIPVFG